MQKGQTLIELLLAIVMTAIFLPVLLTGLISSRDGKAQQNQRIDASFLLKQGQEAVRNARETNWGNVAINGTYHPTVSGSTWILPTGTETVNGLTRQVVITDVYRDPVTGAIILTPTPGVSFIDASTRRAVISVSWNTPIPASIDSTVYLTRFLNNSTFLQTTHNDFISGTSTPSGSIVTNYFGGEVTLGAGGHGNWCDPNLTINAVDLPKNGVANAIWAIPGQIVAGTGDNASGISFGHVTMTNPAFPTPPEGTLDGTFDGYKTNAVFVEPNFAYIGTDNNSREVIILDLTEKDDGKYEQIGYFNAPGNGTGNSVFISGNIGYMTDGNNLYTFDLSSKSGARPQLNTASPVNLAGTGNKITVSGSYIYVATQSTTNQLQIYQSSPDGKTITFVGQTTGLTTGYGQDVFVNASSSRAYLATSYITDKPEFFIINLSNKSNPTLLSSTSVYSTSGMDPKGVNIVPGNKAIIVGTGGTEYQVIDITNENPASGSLPACGPGLNIDTGIHGLSSVINGDRAFSYAISGDSTAELKIIEGGPGGIATSSGVFESSTMAYPSVNNPQQITLNRFDANFMRPATGTDIQFQVAVADAVDGNCNGAAFSYVGPDGTANTKFSTSSITSIGGVFPLNLNGSYINPGYCYRYKVFLTTGEMFASPVLYDITTNFSP